MGITAHQIKNMLISYSKKFIFIHNYKVAGVSIKKCLRQYTTTKEEGLYVSLLKHTGILNHEKSFDGHGHIRAYELKKLLPEKYFDNFFKFGFVRNPWEWQVSLYNFALKRKDHFQHKLVKDFKNFEEYLIWVIENDIHFQSEFFFDKNNNKLVDFIGKLENLNADYKTICKKLGIIWEDLPHENKTDHKNYREYYNEKSRELISKHFAVDIERFEYEF